MSEQMRIKVEPSKRLIDEELDKALHDCITVIWSAYRESVKTHNFKPYNACFPALYAKYPDLAVQRFIQGMGMGLVEAANRRI